MELSTLSFYNLYVALFLSPTNLVFLYIARSPKMADEGGEEAEVGETEDTTFSEDATFSEDTEVVQLIMQDDSGQAILPEGQLIQVTTGEGQMHYIQVGFQLLIFQYYRMAQLFKIIGCSNLTFWSSCNFLFKML